MKFSNEFRNNFSAPRDLQPANDYYSNLPLKAGQCRNSIIFDRNRTKSQLVSKKRILSVRQHYWIRNIRGAYLRWDTLDEIEKLWKKTTGDRFVFATVIVGILTVGLVWLCWISDHTDENSTYYLISVSAIYSTIALAYLLQKITGIRAQKENLLNTSTDKWLQFSYYRYMCSYPRSGISANAPQAYNQSKKLSITIHELFYVNMGRLENVDHRHYNEINIIQADYNIFDYTLLVKMLDYINSEPVDAFLALSFGSRTYAYDNRSVNDYLTMLSIQGVFDQLDKVSTQWSHLFPGLADIFVSLSKLSLYQKLSQKAGLIEVTDTLTRLKLIEKYIGDILLSLYDSTFIIEKKLPKAFNHLLVNACAILCAGTIVPLINAFTLHCCRIIEVCAALTGGLLMLSLILICLTFIDENNRDIFKYSTVIYRGKNDQFTT